MNSQTIDTLGVVIRHKRPKSISNLVFNLEMSISKKKLKVQICHL
jgi:hypothetical protein